MCFPSLCSILVCSSFSVVAASEVNHGVIFQLTAIDREKVGARKADRDYGIESHC